MTERRSSKLDSSLRWENLEQDAVSNLESWFHRLHCSTQLRNSVLCTLSHNESGWNIILSSYQPFVQQKDVSEAFFFYVCPFCLFKLMGCKLMQQRASALSSPKLRLPACLHESRSKHVPKRLYLKNILHVWLHHQNIHLFPESEELQGVDPTAFPL